MTVGELVTVMDDNEDVVIVPTWRTAAGMYRYKAKHIPPTLLSASVVMVYPHSNGEELIVEAER